MTAPADAAPLDGESVFRLLRHELQVVLGLAAVFERADGEGLFHDATHAIVSTDAPKSTVNVSPVSTVIALP